MNSSTSSSDSKGVEAGHVLYTLHRFDSPAVGLLLNRFAVVGPRLRVLGGPGAAHCHNVTSPTVSMPQQKPAWSSLAGAGNADRASKPGWADIAVSARVLVQVLLVVVLPSMR